MGGGKGLEHSQNIKHLLKMSLISDNMEQDLKAAKWLKEGRADKEVLKDIHTANQKYHKMPATEIPRYEKLKQADKNLSDKAYHQEWEDEKHMIYYPEHITEGYESKQKMNKLRGNEYKRK